MADNSTGCMVVVADTADYWDKLGHHYNHSVSLIVAATAVEWAVLVGSHFGIASVLSLRSIL